MKRLLKKLVAGAMAGVMALGMVVTAGAATNVTGNTLRGGGKLEGKPTAAITIVVPTLANNDLNMVLDPHSMIALTKGEAWKDTAGRTPTFEAGSNVFFRNKVKNTAPQEDSSFTLDGATSKAKLFKKVEPLATPAYVYRSAEKVSGNYKWFSDLTTEDSSTTYVEVIDTTAPPASSSTDVYVRATTDKDTATVSSTDYAVIKYEKVTVTGLWFLEDEDDATKNKSFTAQAGVSTGKTGANQVAALDGKGIAEITGSTQNYTPVPSTEYAYDYSSNTDDLKVINKSYIPLTVRVQAELDKFNNTTTSASVTLVDSKDKLVNEEDGKAKGALMYLALVNDAEEDPAVLKDPESETDDTTDPPTITYMVGNPLVTRDFTSVDLTPATISNLDLIKGQPLFAWDTDDNDVKDALNKKLKADGTTQFQITYDNTKDTFGVTTLDNQDDSGSYVLEIVLQDEDAEDPTVVKGNGADVPVYVNIKASANDDAVAHIAMTLDGHKAGSVTAAVTKDGASGKDKGPAVIITKWQPKSEANSKAVMPVFESGFKLASSGATAQAALYDNSSITSGATYTYTINPDVPESRFNSASFHISAGINTVEAWDLAKADQLHLSLIYDVNQYNADTDGALPEDEEPTVTVVTPGGEGVTSTKMTVTMGTGNSAYDTIKEVKYNLASGAAKTITIPTSGNTFDKDTLTVVLKYANSGSSSMIGSTGWTMVFLNELTNETKEVAFDIHTAS